MTHRKTNEGQNKFKSKICISMTDRAWKSRATERKGAYMDSDWFETELWLRRASLLRRLVLLLARGHPDHRRSRGRAELHPRAALGPWRAKGNIRERARECLLAKWPQPPPPGQGLQFWSSCMAVLPLAAPHIRARTEPLRNDQPCEPDSSSARPSS